MSSTTFTRLRSVFSKVPSPAVTSIKPKPTAAIPPSFSQDEKFLPLVKQFKKSTDNPRFRRDHLYNKGTVRRLGSGEHFSAIQDIRRHQKKYPDITDEECAARLIGLYGKANMFEEAQKLFDEMPRLNCERTVISFNALLGACINSKNFHKVSELFKELREKLSLQPNTGSYNKVVKALCEMGSPDSAVVLMDEMEKNNIKPDVKTFNPILDEFYKVNRIEEAEKLWGLMEKKNVRADIRSYNSRLRGFVLDNRILDAVELIEEMNKKGVKPNYSSYNALMKGFVDAGHLREAKTWYKKMMANGCIPDKETYDMLIPFACDEDDFDYAFELCKNVVKTKQMVHSSVVQRVIDGLFERSKNDEAEKLVNMAKFEEPRIY